MAYDNHADGVYGHSKTKLASEAEAMREITDEYDEIPEVIIPCKGELAPKDKSHWYLGISRDDFIHIYDGLGVDVALFDNYPDSDADMVENFLPSKLWRLNNLYFIINKDGYKMQFLMNYAQHVVYAASLFHPRIIILKSRQQGISTFWLISYEDDGIFNTDYNIGMLAQGLEEAGTLLTRSKLAWDNFPSAIKELFNIYLTSDNTKSLGFSNGSTIFIRTSFRSATLQRLHVSELGKIANKDPKKAKELKTGTMQAIAAGHTVVIESTAEGTDNMFSIMWDEAVNFSGKNRPPKAFYPVFLSWTQDPDCNLELDQDIDRDAQAYFDKVEQELQIRLTRTQKNFWVQQFAELGEDIGQEYPATPDEAFSSVRDGTYYARQFRKHVMDGGRMVSDLHDPALPVYASMDLGLDDDTVIIFFQVYELEWRIIDEYHNSGEHLGHYATIITTMPYRIKRLFLPHDSRARSMQTRMSTFGILKKLGLPAVALKKTDVQDGIENVRKLIPHLWVDAKLHYVRDTFLSYTKTWDDNLGKWKSKPLHNKWSDPADALRYMAVSGVGALKSDFEELYLANKKANQVDPDFPDHDDELYAGVIVDGLAL